MSCPADDVWRIEMEGLRGYKCWTYVSCANAKDESEAKQIAAWMFPGIAEIKSASRTARPEE